MKTKNSLLFFTFWIIVLVALVNWLAGELYLYWTIEWFDNLVHFLGGFSMGLLTLWAFYALDIFKGKAPTLKQAIFASLLGVIIIGIGWEIFEYLNGMTMSTESYPLDVAHDLISDVAGAVVAALVGRNKNFYLSR